MGSGIRVYGLGLIGFFKFLRVSGFGFCDFWFLERI